MSATPSELVIRVHSTGGDNRARVLGRGVAASCTASPEDAARRAAEKVLGRASFHLECREAPGIRKPGLYVAIAKV
jgi:hypothetical protein